MYINNNWITNLSFSQETKKTKQNTLANKTPKNVHKEENKNNKREKMENYRENQWKHEPKYPTLQVDSSYSEPPEKPIFKIRSWQSFYVKTRVVIVFNLLNHAA